MSQFVDFMEVIAKFALLAISTLLIFTVFKALGNGDYPRVYASVAMFFVVELTDLMYRFKEKL